MRYLTDYRLFEAADRMELTIGEFLKKIGFANQPDRVIEWWNSNRKHIEIYYFPFSSPEPIGGVVLGKSKIALNQRLPIPPHILLFLALHESRHCDQETMGIFNPKYYEPVVNGDFELFSEGYAELEKDANDFAVAAFREMGIYNLIEREVDRLRMNERAAQFVYKMMRQDIRKYEPADFIDLLSKQVL